MAGVVAHRPRPTQGETLTRRPAGASGRPMDFNLTDDQRAIEDAARAFAEAELAPHSARWDEEKHFPVDVLRKAAELGFAGLYVQEDVGGSALGRLKAQMVIGQQFCSPVEDLACLPWRNVDMGIDHRVVGNAL